MHSCHKDILLNENFLTDEKFYMRINKMFFLLFYKESH